MDYLNQFTEPETRASYRAAVRCFHAWLVDTGRASENPARAVPSVRRPTRTRTHITDREILDAIATATPDVAAMIVLGRMAGLRAAEIAAAHRSYLRGPAGEEVVGLIGKGDRWREVPAHPMVADLLRQTAGYLFPSTRCGRLTGLPQQGVHSPLVMKPCRPQQSGQNSDAVRVSGSSWTSVCARTPVGTHRG